jgi:hypothetical protein
MKSWMKFQAFHIFSSFGVYLFFCYGYLLLCRLKITCDLTFFGNNGLQALQNDNMAISNVVAELIVG